MYAALSRGLSFKTTMGNILTLTPPLIITREEMDRALAIRGSIAEVEKQDKFVTPAGRSPAPRPILPICFYNPGHANIASADP